MEEEIVEKESASPASSRRGLEIVALVLLCAMVISVVYMVRAENEVKHWSSKNEELSVALTQTRNQVATLASKLDAMSSALAAREAAPIAAPPKKLSHAAAGQTSARRRLAEDPRWKQVEAQLTEHQKEIASTQQDVENARSELAGKLKSAEDELGGSIARTHEELVALEKKGERNYYEFDLDKSKQFKRSGPISISLHRINSKHQYCDLELLVDDIQLTKKHVNLYEPVMFYPAESQQPIELVINKIGKEGIHGYTSAPKSQGGEVNASSANRGFPSSTDAQPGPASDSAALAHRPEDVK